MDEPLSELSQDSETFAMLMRTRTVKTENSMKTLCTEKAKILLEGVCTRLLYAFTQTKQ